VCGCASEVPRVAEWLAARAHLSATSFVERGLDTALVVISNPGWGNPYALSVLWQ
jgi:hypothetical protein